MESKLLPAFQHLPQVLPLMEEYFACIRQHGEDVDRCLEVQDLEKELSDLAHKYVRFYLCTIDGRDAGCVGLLENDKVSCEVKRLYLRPEYRGRHISRILLDQVIQDARNLGYCHMRLDTFPTMVEAIGLYESYGFYRIENYNDNPAKTAIFMQLDL